MILLLGDADDLVLKSFANYLNKENHDYQIVEKIQDLTFSIKYDNIQADFTLYVKNKKVIIEEISGIFNRILPSSFNDNSFFEREEYISAIWSLLATINCPVINRPNQYGFYQNPNLNTILKLLGNRFILDRRILNSGNYDKNCKIQKDITNGTDIIHDSNSKFQYIEVADFDPQKTYFFLLAGEKVINLSIIENKKIMELMNKLESVKDFHIFKEVQFCLFIFEDINDKWKLLHSTTYPQYFYYQHIETDINKNLYEFINGKK